MKCHAVSPYSVIVGKYAKQIRCQVVPTGTSGQFYITGGRVSWTRPCSKWEMTSILLVAKWWSLFLETFQTARRASQKYHFLQGDSLPGLHMSKRSEARESEPGAKIEFFRCFSSWCDLNSMFQMCSWNVVGERCCSSWQDSWFFLQVEDHFSLYAVFDGHGQAGGTCWNMSEWCKIQSSTRGHKGRTRA